MEIWKVRHWFLCLCCIALTAEAAAPENPYLAEARVFYLGLEYAKCGERTVQARNWENTKAQLAEIELYAGLCSFGLRRERSAAHHFALAKALQPEISLPPHSSPKIVQLFESVGTSVAPLVSDVPVDAPKPAPAPPSAQGPDLFSSPPPRPHDPSATQVRIVRPLRPVTWILAGLSIVGAGTGTVLGLRAQSLAGEARDARFEIDAYQTGRAAQATATAANVAFGVAASVAVVAILTHVLGKVEAP